MYTHAYTHTHTHTHHTHAHNRHTHTHTHTYTHCACTWKHLGSKKIFLKFFFDKMKVAPKCFHVHAHVWGGKGTDKASSCNNKTNNKKPKNVLDAHAHVWGGEGTDKTSSCSQKKKKRHRQNMFVSPIVLIVSPLFSIYMHMFGGERLLLLTKP